MVALMRTRQLATALCAIVVCGMLGVLLWRLGPAWDRGSLAGPKLWQTQLSSRILSAPLAVGDKIVVQSLHEVVALERDSGKVVWETRFDADPYSNPAIRATAEGRLLIVGGLNGRLTALLSSDGTPNWQTAASQNSWIEDVEIGQGLVYAAVYGGEVIAYRETDGGVAWRKFTRSHSPLWLFAGGATLYVGTSTTLWALDGKTGLERRELPLRNHAAKMVGDSEALYIAFNGSDGFVSVEAIELLSQSSMWYVKRLGVRNGDDMIVRDGSVYVGGAGVAALSAKNGDVLWERASESKYSRLNISGGHLFARGPGRLSVLEMATGMVAREYRWPGWSPELSWALKHEVGPVADGDLLLLAEERTLYACSSLLP